MVVTPKVCYESPHLWHITGVNQFMNFHGSELERKNTVSSIFFVQIDLNRCQNYVWAWSDATLQSWDGLRRVDFSSSLRIVFKFQITLVLALRRLATSVQEIIWFRWFFPSIFHSCVYCTQHARNYQKAIMLWIDSWSSVESLKGYASPMVLDDKCS